MIAQLRCILFLAMALLAVPVSAQDEVLRAHVPDAELVGAARLQMFFFKIYDAQLFAPNGRFSRDDAYALRLTYLIDAKKDKIVERTVKEMKRQKAASSSVIEGWVPLMEANFISMPSGSSADFIHTADGRLILAANGDAIAEITNRRFIKALMDIWLGPKARDPEFQRKLMGTAE